MSLPGTSPQTNDMAALLQAAELLRLEEEGNLDQQTLQRYGLSPNSFPQRSSISKDSERCMCKFRFSLPVFLSLFLLCISSPIKIIL